MGFQMGSRTGKAIQVVPAGAVGPAAPAVPSPKSMRLSHGPSRVLFTRPGPGPAPGPASLSHWPHTVTPNLTRTMTSGGGGRPFGVVTAAVWVPGLFLLFATVTTT